jgi:serine/threonine protein phosphatase PrpC
LFKLLGEISSAKDGEQSNDQLMLDSIGCTANVIMIEDMKKLYVANAGDSRCVLARGGKAIPLSFDHKPDNEEEKKRIEKAGSTITEGRVDGNLNLSRAIGDLKYKQNKSLKPEEHPVTGNPDIYEYELTGDEDFIVMGCDGIWETKSNEEMVEFLYKKFEEGKDLKTINEELLNDIISPDYTATGKNIYSNFTAGVGCDNMSVILIKFNKK